jgi:pimeloyl-ACP methyl ester carboxylesterase
VSAEHPQLVRALIIGDSPFAIEDHPADEQNHRAMNVLWHSLAGRPVEEIDAALRDMPITVPGNADARRAEDVFGIDSLWFAFQSWNLHVLDPDVLGTVLEGPTAVRAGYDFDLLLPQITCPVLILQADPASGGLLRDEDVAHALALLPNATRTRLTGIGHELHGPPGQTPRVHDAMTSFLDGLPTAPANQSPEHRVQ